MDRAKAKSMTRTVQAITAVLLCAAVAAAVVPTGASAPAAEQPPAAPQSAPAAPQPKAQAAPIDFAPHDLAANLDAVSGPVKNGPKPPEPAGPQPPQPTVARTGPESWKYLGGIISDSYKRAVIVIEDQQRLLAEGQTFKPDPHADTEYQVLQIDPAFVRVKHGDDEHTINAAPRQRAALNVLDPAAARAAASGYAAPGFRAGAPTNANAAANANAARNRDLERMKADAKARGDLKTAELIDAKMNAAGEEGKFEKGEKGQK